MPYARVSTYEFPADRVAEAGPAFQDGVRNLQGIEGITEALFLLDRSSGKAMTITIWESEDTLRASEQQADQIRQGAASSGGGEITSVDRFEIALRETF